MKRIVVSVSVILLLAAAAFASDGGNTVTVEVEGYQGPMTVDVTFEADTLIDVEVVDHEETDGLADEPFEVTPAEMIDGQTTDVEAVSGATGTSEALIEAVELAADELGIDL